MFKIKKSLKIKLEKIQMTMFNTIKKVLHTKHQQNSQLPPSKRIYIPWKTKGIGLLIAALREAK